MQYDRYNGFLRIGSIKEVSWNIKRRRQIIEMYNEALENANVQVLDHYNEESSSSRHLYLVRLLGKDEGYRNKVIEKMAKKELVTNVHYKPLPMHTAYKNLGFEIKIILMLFDMYKNEITLPLHTLLSDGI